MADKIIERVARHDAPPTLKAFILSAWPDLSGNRVNGLLHRGQVMLRGSITTQFDAPVAEGDAVAINFTRPYPQLRHQRLQLLYEDDDVAVVNKGYGLLSVSRGAARPEATAYNIVKEYLKVVDPRQKVFIVHRLDRDTSGLMMFAKTPEAKEAMQHNWNNMVLERRYVAVVEGNVEQDEGVWLGVESVEGVATVADRRQRVSFLLEEEDVWAEEVNLVVGPEYPLHDVIGIKVLLFRLALRLFGGFALGFGGLFGLFGLPAALRVGVLLGILFDGRRLWLLLVGVGVAEAEVFFK